MLKAAPIVQDVLDAFSRFFPARRGMIELASVLQNTPILTNGYAMIVAGQFRVVFLCFCLPRVSAISVQIWKDEVPALISCFKP